MFSAFLYNIHQILEGSMISYETHILPNSDYYVYTPSTLAKKLFFYPICIGSFRYESGYRLARDSYDSFLMMYILKGTCFVTVGSHTMQAMADQLVLLGWTDGTYLLRNNCVRKRIFALSSSPGCHPQIPLSYLRYFPQPCTNCRRPDFRHDHKYSV